MTPLIIAVANLKGGTGKTTSTAYLAHAFRSMSRSVLIVDADPQASITEWAEISQWEIPTVGLPSKTIHKRLRGIAGTGYDVVLIDTPPFYPLEVEGDNPFRPTGIVDSALRAADLVVVPLAPTLMELRRVHPTLEAIRRAGGRDVRFLLNRAVANASSTRGVRTTLAAGGSQVFAAEIPRLEALAQSFGAPITGPLHGYLSAALELENQK